MRHHNTRQTYQFTSPWAGKVIAGLITLAILGGGLWYLTRLNTLRLDALIREQLDTAALQKRVTVLADAWLTLEQAQTRTKTLQENLKQEELHVATTQIAANAAFWESAWWAGAAFLYAALIAAGCGGMIWLYRKGDVVYATLHGNFLLPMSRRWLNTHVYYERILPYFAQIAEAESWHGLAATEHGEAQADRAIQRTLDIGRALQGRPGSAGVAALPPAALVLTDPVPGRIPTFAELLSSGELAPGKLMILGYVSHAPRRGSFEDIYSAAVAGESGSGKTGTLLFLVGGALLTHNGQIEFYGCDPHFPHPKSFGAKTRELWARGWMKFASYLDDMVEIFTIVEQRIDARMQQADTTTHPVVLVIDELAFLSKTAIGSAVAHTMERISTEGRKCAVYMLASSQTWLASRSGESSVVRDTLTCSYVHRIKPKQANLLLQDRPAVDLVRTITKPGRALFSPVNDEAVIVDIPYTVVTEHDAAGANDMRRVVEQLTANAALPFFPPVAPERLRKPQHLEVAALLDQAQRDLGWSQRDIEQQTGVKQHALSRARNKAQGRDNWLTTKEITTLRETIQAAMAARHPAPGQHLHQLDAVGASPCITIASQIPDAASDAHQVACETLS